MLECDVREASVSSRGERASRQGPHRPTIESPARAGLFTAMAILLTAPTRPAGRAAGAERAEHHRRLAAAALLVYCLVQTSVGLAWDIRWHGAVGRDTFWSPPHLLMYSGVAVAGLLCLAMVLQTTLRYRRGDPALSEDNTLAVLGVIRGPLGFVVAGFGLLTMLAAAPLDDYWHRLYGIDVALWAPFHVMGLISGGIAGLGAIYAVAAAAARARARGWVRLRLGGYSGLELLTLFAISGLLNGMFTAAQPGAWQFPTLDLGPLRVLTYPLLLTLAVGVLGVASVRLTRRPGAATLMVGMYVVRQALLAAFVPWAIRLTVAQQSLEYRNPAAEPSFQAIYVAIAALFLVPALVVDLGVRWTAGRDLARVRAAALVGLAVAVPLFALGTALVYTLMPQARALGAPPEVFIPLLPPASAAWLALPAALLVGALAGALGSGLGAVLRLNER
jgi:hypothetical protein